MRGHLSKALVPAILTAVACATAVAASGQGVRVDSETFGGLRARAIGPATMSGRITALDAVAGDRTTVFVATAGGGLWKSADGGIVFKPVFDRHNQSVGAVTVDRANPRVVWAGTGESWVRNSVAPGDGVYRSSDGGDSWTRVGLEQTERISRIVIHPKDAATVYVCALGAMSADHPDRGVYRTTDAGKTWEKILFVAPTTGCADLAIDPQDPTRLYAGMWQFRRQPWHFTSGGPGSGLYRSTDGGATWSRLSAGLPPGELGRIAVAVAPSSPSRVYATVEAARTMLYRSDDRGDTWAALSDASAVTTRPFYYSRLVIDPLEASRLYKVGQTAAASEDGGRTFGGIGGGGLFGPSYHPDVHDVWINPANSEHVIIGTDGGVYISYNRGTTFRFVGGLPVSQFYHVSVDMEVPYNVYGGLQDNNTWYGPSRRAGGVANRHWNSLTGGDGFWVFVDPTDSDIVYSEYQGGNLFRTRKSTLESKDIKPSPAAGEAKYRFNWNTPIHLSPNDPGTLYYAAQFVFRSRDRGESWTRISPDLTTNDPAKLQQHTSGGLTLDNSTAENHCTIFAIAEAPGQPGVIWVGTDDGQVQLTRDGGGTWANLTANLRGVPPHTWVSSIDASRHAPGTAFVTFDGHWTGDMAPYVFRTTDFGATWTALATPDLKGYVHIVRQDPVNPDLLFVGTEFGLFVSLDAGRQWAQFTANLPNVAVRDLVIHPRDHDLVLATHGRGIYVIDDLTPLRALSAEALERDVAFLPVRPSAMVAPVSDSSTNGDGEFVGDTPSESASIVYYLKRRHMVGDMRLEVYDQQGTLVATLDALKRRGLNRVEWPMRSKVPRSAPGTAGPTSLFALLGPRVPAGTYHVKMIKADQTYESTVTLVPDPRSRHTDEDRQIQQQTVRTLYGMVEQLAYVVSAVIDARDQVRDRAGRVADGQALKARLTALADELERQRTALAATQRGEGISGEQKLREEIGALYGNVNGYEGRPTRSQLDRMAVLQRDLDAALAAFEATLAKQAAGLAPQLASLKLAPITRLTREAWDKR